MPQVRDIAMDVGTSHVLIYMRGRGLILREPAVVAVDRDTNRIRAVGSDAYRLLGRTPANVQAVRPLRQGLINDFELTRQMLLELVGHALNGRSFFNRPRCVMSVPTGVSETEQRSLISVMFDAGMRRTQLLSRPVAAALGVGMEIDKSYGAMVVDMGAGASDIAVLSGNEVVVGSCVPVGGDYFDDAIIRYLRKKHNLLIGERTAEEIKISIGSAMNPTGHVAMDVTGRNLISGLPKTVNISASEIYEALKDPVADLIDAIQGVIERTAPQLASDIFEDGIVLTGGAASLNGLPEAIYQVLEIPVGVADNPDSCVVLGCARALEDTPEMRDLLGDGRKHWFR
ncbi:MAG: rod shape-determining protein [Clostridia bacterium]|nr:rod shape-determining protein [Clostridia bacterium]